MPFDVCIHVPTEHMDTGAFEVTHRAKGVLSFYTSINMCFVRCTADKGLFTVFACVEFTTSLCALGSDLKKSNCEHIARIANSLRAYTLTIENLGGLPSTCPLSPFPKAILNLFYAYYACK